MEPGGLWWSGRVGERVRFAGEGGDDGGDLVWRWAVM
jgi:hypothetical protein